MRARRLPHRSTYILVLDARGDLFVHLRTATKDVYPSHWDPCVGGVLAAGENFVTGAARELREELGVAAPLDELFPFRWTDAHNVVHGMVFRARHGGPFRLQPEEIVRGEFLPLDIVEERAWGALLPRRARRRGGVPAPPQRVTPVMRRISDGNTSISSSTAPTVKRSSPSTPCSQSVETISTTK